MPIEQYSLLKGRAVDMQQGSGKSPHFQVLVIDNTAKYRIAVNVQSQDGSELFFLVRSNFVHPIRDAFLAAPRGLTAVQSKPGGLALDFIRGNLFQPDEMRQLPISVPGPDNDLNEKIGQYVQRAMADEDAEIYALGAAWGPEPKKQDNYFHFLPGRGIHDIHMNQGNPKGSHDQDNGVWQDGGLLFHFPAQSQWVAIFLKFKTQAWHTDDKTGNALPPGGSGPPSDPTEPPGTPGQPPTTDQPDGQVCIVAAYVNDVKSPEQETVTLVNTTHQPVDLKGWTLKDKNKQATALSGVIPPGEALRVTVAPPMTLSNKGGIISLINAAGLKVHGVSYTEAQASQPGRTLVF